MPPSRTGREEEEEQFEDPEGLGSEPSTAGLQPRKKSQAAGQEDHSHGQGHGHAKKPFYLADLVAGTSAVEPRTRPSWFDGRSIFGLRTFPPTARLYG